MTLHQQMIRKLKVLRKDSLDQYFNWISDEVVELIAEEMVKITKKNTTKEISKTFN